MFIDVERCMSRVEEDIAEALDTIKMLEEDDDMRCQREAALRKRVDELELRVDAIEAELRTCQDRENEHSRGYIWLHQLIRGLANHAADTSVCLLDYMSLVVSEIGLSGVVAPPVTRFPV
jgi:chromosome segregation ATPase